MRRDCHHINPSWMFWWLRVQEEPGEAQGSRTSRDAPPTFNHRSRGAPGGSRPATPGCSSAIRADDLFRTAQLHQCKVVTPANPATRRQCCSFNILPPLPPWNENTESFTVQQNHNYYSGEIKENDHVEHSISQQSLQRLGCIKQKIHIWKQFVGIFLKNNLFWAVYANRESRKCF